MRFSPFILILGLLGCGAAKAPAKVVPSDASIAKFQEVEARALTFLDQGFIVSRRGGAPVNQGDALLFTGLGAYAADCDAGAALSLSMAEMLDATDGGLFRHPSLPTSASLDGALGFYRGVTKRANKCGEGAQWGELIGKHLGYVDGHSGLLNAGDNATLPVGFDYIPRKLAANLSFGPVPPGSKQAELESAIAGWAEADVQSHSACFRANLGLIALQTVEELGSQISREGKAAFCAATRGSGLPTVDNWCGRGGLDDYLSGFQYDVWQYRHQRCTGWETPDGHGDSQPGIDYLVGWADYHG